MRGRNYFTIKKNILCSSTKRGYLMNARMLVVIKNS